jgi:hypothetical protein
LKHDCKEFSVEKIRNRVTNRSEKKGNGKVYREKSFGK